MSEINTDAGGGGKGKHGGGKVRAKKQSTRIDMTPMVDLAFLLLTFFMLTTTFSKPKSMEINVPAKPDKNEPEKKDETKIKESQALTIILASDDKVHYYAGFPSDTTNLLVTDFSKNGIRKILLERNKKVYDKIEDLRKKFDMGEMRRDTFKARSARIKTEDKKGIVVLIKTTDKAKYKNVVNILDEMNICNVGRYALMELQAPDFKLLTKANLK